jgi:polyisoprenoid-binding protein YceI
MTAFRIFAVGAACASLLAGGAALAEGEAKPAPQPPAGQYYLDKSHTSVVFRVSHLGFSNYTANFSRVDGTLKFDPANPGAMQVEATIDPTSLALNAPPAGFHDALMGSSWFEAAKFPKITFRSTKVEVTGPQSAKVTGDLSLHGVSQPVVLEVTYNGGYPPMSFDPGGARIGFSAHGVLKRSAFGMGYGVPAPGSTMGVSDEVQVAIVTEFSSKPPATK